MNIAASTKSAVNTASQPRNAVDITSAVLGCLTILAALPYELGEVATIMPVEWKPWVVKIGVFATVALRIVRLFMQSPNVQQPTVTISSTATDITSP